MNISKEFKIGLLAVVSISTLYLGLNYLKGINVFSSTNHFYVIYNNIDGLQEGNQVMINGLSVGRISNISLLKEDKNPLLIEIEVEKNIYLYSNTVAELKNASLLGDKIINLIINNNGIPLKSGDTLSSRIVEGFITKISDKAIPIINNFETLLNNMNGMINKYSILNDTLQEFLIVLKNDLQTTQKKINQTLDNTSSLLESSKNNLDTLTKKMSRVADSLNVMPLVSLTKELQKGSAQLNKTIRTLNGSKGSLGKILNEPQLYDDLNQTIRHLDSLFIDLQKNPKRYVHFSLFGKKDKK